MKMSNPLYLSVLFVKSFLTMLKALAPVWGVLTVLIGILGILIGLMEDIGWWDGLYFGFVTGITIGYGDIYPTTVVARCLSIFIGIIGIVNTGLIVAMAVNAGRLVADHTGITKDIKSKLEKTLGQGPQ